MPNKMTADEISKAVKRHLELGVQIKMLEGEQKKLSLDLKPAMTAGTAVRAAIGTTKSPMQLEKVVQRNIDTDHPDTIEALTENNLMARCTETKVTAKKFRAALEDPAVSEIMEGHVHYKEVIKLVPSAVKPEDQ